MLNRLKTILPLFEFIFEGDIEATLRNAELLEIFARYLRIFLRNPLWTIGESNLRFAVYRNHGKLVMSIPESNWDYVTYWDFANQLEKMAEEIRDIL